MSMTEEELARIEARAKAAGAGPWSVEYTEMGMAPDARLIAFLKDDDDRYLAVDEDPSAIDGPPSPVLEFCASAREDIPALIAALREAWRERDDAFKAEAFAWADIKAVRGTSIVNPSVMLLNKDGGCIGIVHVLCAEDNVRFNVERALGSASNPTKMRRFMNAARNGEAEANERAEKSAAERDALRAQVATLREALGWYGENARLCRLIHSGGDIGRKALDEDGGEKARGALATKPEDMP
jgi:hypothetical protein